MKSSIQKFLLSLLAFAFVAGGIATHAADVTGYDPVLIMVGITVGVVAAEIVFPKIQAHRHGIDVNLWVAYVMEKLLKNNQFIEHAYSDDQYIQQGKYVIIPQAGDSPNVVKNRSVFPAPVNRRVDHTIFYPLEWYTTDPLHITDADQHEASYNKMDSIIGDHVNTLSESVGDDLLIKWLTELPQSNIILTTGDNTSELLEDATGTRKVMVYQELKLAKRKLDAQNVPGNDRYALISANMMDELTTSLSATQYTDFSRYFDATTGVIGRLFGFNIMVRSEVARFGLESADLIVKPWGSENEATDRDVAMVWQKDCITRALGNIDMFEDEGSAIYFGDVYSAQVFMGGRRRRADHKGVIAIVQGA